MSWSIRRNAITLLDGSIAVRNVPATSIAVIRPDMAATALRMYGVTPGQLQRLPLSTANYLFQNSFATASTNESLYQIGMVAGNRGTSGQDFRLRLSTTTPIISSTSVAAAREVSASGESVITFDYDAAFPVKRTFDPSELLMVRYKDPCVLYVPSIGRWMLVLCRVRIFANNGGSFAPGNATPLTAISDIVAYTDVVDTFDSSDVNSATNPGLWGPYWLASSTSGLQVNYRVSLGVPCAFEYTNSAGAASLYLYYSMDPCNLTTNNNTQISLSVDNASQTSYPGAAFTPMLGMKAMSTNHFLTPPTVAEADWETSLSSYHNNIVPGSLQRSVRLWAAVFGSASNEVVRFEQAMANVRAVDPSVVVDALNTNQPAANPRAASYTAGEDISLYFAANMNVLTPPSVPYAANGIWRATAVPEGWTGYLSILDQNGQFRRTLTPTLGVDFLVRHVSFNTNSQLQVQGMDHVAQSTGTTDANVDPEPVMLLSGTWRVFLGHGDVYTPGQTVILQYVENGSTSDVFCSISNAWT